MGCALAESIMAMPAVLKKNPKKNHVLLDAERGEMVEALAQVPRPS